MPFIERSGKPDAQIMLVYSEQDGLVGGFNPSEKS